MVPKFPSAPRYLSEFSVSLRIPILLGCGAIATTIIRTEMIRSGVAQLPVSPSGLTLGPVEIWVGGKLQEGLDVRKWAEQAEQAEHQDPF